MSRAAVYDAILVDSRLQALGFDASSVLVSYDGKQRPNDKMFMVLRWEAHNIDIRLGRGPRDLVIWVHMYREFSTDFVRIDDVIEILDDILVNLVQVDGADGRTLTTVESSGRSRDLKDDSYQTICRSASYRVLSRVTAS
jgi:hypothetical protein